MVLQQFENGLERLVEGVFARMFRSGLQPVEIGRRLTREMDLRRSMGPRGAMAPNVFLVTLSHKDADRFAPFADALVRELAEVARDHARSEDYELVGPVSVTIETSSRFAAGTFSLTSEMDDGGSAVPYAALVLPDGARVVIGEEPSVIGRLPACAVSLSDPNVSRHHAELRWEDGAVVLSDLGSTNGTRVNGVAVRRQRLLDGDEVAVGTTVLHFETS